MNESKISTRYAKALFLSAREHNSDKPVREDMEMILAAIVEVPEMRQMLESPVIKSGKKKEILTALFDERVHQLSSAFLKLLIENKREEYLAGIARAYIKYFKEEAGIKTAVLKTAREVHETLHEELKELIARALQSTIEISEEIDEDLVGGFLLRVEDQQIDASVSTQLNRIRKELSKSIIKNDK